MLQRTASERVYCRFVFSTPTRTVGRSQWPRRLRRRPAPTRLLGLWVWIPSGHGCLSFVSVVCCQRFLRRADHSFGGIPPAVVRRCVWSRNLTCEKAITRVGPQHHKKKKNRNGWNLIVHHFSNTFAHNPQKIWGISRILWRTFLFLFDTSSCHMFSAIISQLFPTCDHL